MAPFFSPLPRCPACGEGLELTFTTAELAGVAEPATVDALTIEQDGYTVRCRLPESTDLKALAGEMDASLVQAQLLERCILSARHMSDQCDGADLPKRSLQPYPKPWKRQIR